jgi:hypothetical protein
MHPQSSSQDFLEGGPANKGEAIRKFTNSIGKRTLPNRRILSRVIYYACSL